MQDVIDLTAHFDDLARAVTFDVQSIGQIELEALMLDITDGAPVGLLTFEGAGFTIHPVLMMAVLPAFTNGVARLAGIDDLTLDNPVAWIDAGYTSVGAVLTGIFSDTAQKLLAWGSTVLNQEGYCPLEVLLNSMATSEPFDQVKIRSLFRQSGLRPIAAA